MQVRFISLAVLLFVSALVYFADADYIMVEGGNCLTYDNTLPGTLVEFEPCNFVDPRHNSWKSIQIKDDDRKTDDDDDDDKKYLICIGRSHICTQVAADGKVYLAKKDDENISQQWTSKSEEKRLKNGLTGKNFCAQAIDDSDHDRVPDYIQMQPCSDSRNQQFLTFISSNDMSEHFYTLTDKNVAANYPFPRWPFYNPYNYPQPIIPYYYN